MILKLIALDADGSVYEEVETETAHSISEMEYFISRWKLKLLEGEIVNIIIERKDDG